MNISEYIGNTPMIKLNLEDEKCADIYVKLEMFNPGGSIKTRVAAGMIEKAESMGKIKKGDTVIEATGGNTGVGLAIICNIKGYKLIAVVPDNYSQRRIAMLKLYGAKVLLSDSTEGNDSHIKLVKKIIKDHPDYFWVNQFENDASIDAHYNGTAREIYEVIHPDAFVACVGSAGTFQGIGSYLKERNPEVKLFAVQPKGCDLKNGKAIKHKVQGVSLGIIPKLLDYSIISDYIDVEFEKIKETILWLAKKEGIFLGLSSGANILAAIEVSKKLGRGKIVCTVAPDGGDNYFDEIM